MKWSKIGHRVDREGTTIIYGSDGSDITIESRKRHIPHAGRPGTWDHTTYFVLKDGKELVEKYSLRDAYDYAEALEGQS